jgi:hypothetical protein
MTFKHVTFKVVYFNETNGDTEVCNVMQFVKS